MSLSAIPRLWRVVLVISLALNLVVVGLVAGAILDGRGPGERDRIAGPTAPFLRSLPREDRRAVLGHLRESGGPRAARAERRARFEALLAAVRAEPFRPEAVSAALAEQRRLGEVRLARAEAALVRQLGEMSADARAAYADALAANVRRR